MIGSTIFEPCLRRLQPWTLAAGFALGQLGAFPDHPVYEPPPFVRLLHHRRPGLAAGETVGRRTIVTLPEPLAGAEPWMTLHCPN